MLRHVANDERDKIYYHSIDSQVYPILRINSNHKYFFWQDCVSSFDEEVNKEINTLMLSNKRLSEKKVLEKVNKDGIRNTEFDRILEMDYTLKYENSEFLLYRVK